MDGYLTVQGWAFDPTDVRVKVPHYTANGGAHTGKVLRSGRDARTVAPDALRKGRTADLEPA